MITVNELRISNSNLIISLEIAEGLCTQQDPCKMITVSIYNQKNYNSETALITFDASDDVLDVFSDNDTKFNVTIPLDSNNPLYKEFHDTDLFLVKVCWDGTPTSDCPCGQDENPENFVVYDMRLIYQKGMQYMRGLTNCCADKSNAINFILTQKYFELCLINGALVDAIDLWNKMMNNTSITTTGNCGCHA